MNAARLGEPILVTTTAEGGVSCPCDFARTRTASSPPMKLLWESMKQVTLPFPFVWLTIRVEPAADARRRARFVASPPPTGTSKAAQKLLLSPHLLRDIGLDDSRRD
jgi:hypothetical protein